MVVDRPEGMKIVGESSPSQRLTTLAQPTPGLRLIMPNSIPRQPLHEWRELPSAWALLARSTAPPPANGLTPSQYQPFTGRAAPDAGFYLFFFQKASTRPLGRKRRSWRKSPAGSAQLLAALTAC